MTIQNYLLLAVSGVFLNTKGDIYIAYIIKTVVYIYIVFKVGICK